jgi:hypothetical protein
MLGKVTGFLGPQCHTGHASRRYRALSSSLETENMSRAKCKMVTVTFQECPL